LLMRKETCKVGGGSRERCQYDDIFGHHGSELRGVFAMRRDPIEKTCRNVQKLFATHLKFIGMVSIEKADGFSKYIDGREKYVDKSRDSRYPDYRACY
jgi:hypothetical protein